MNAYRFHLVFAVEPHGFGMVLAMKPVGDDIGFAVETHVVCEELSNHS